MARNRAGIKGSDWRRIKKGVQDLDESDEEYKVTDDEDFEESDEWYPLDGDESEEISTDFVKSKRVSRSRNNLRTSSGRKENKIVKPRKRRRVSFTEDDNDDDDEEFVPMEKKKVSFTDMEDDNGEEYEEFVFHGRNKKHIKKARDKKSVIYSDDDYDYDDAEDEPMEKKKVSYTDADDGCGDDDEEDYKEYAFTDRNKKQRKKSWEKKRVVYTEDENEDDDDGDGDNGDGDNGDGDEDEDDDDEYIYSGKKVNQKKNLQEKRGVSYKEDDDDSVYMSTSKKRNKTNKHCEKRIVSYNEDNQEDDDDESDVEFKLSESDFVDDEDETPKIKKNKVVRPHPHKKSFRDRQKKTKKSKFKNLAHPKHHNHRTLPNKTRIESQNKTSKKRKQKAMSESDSDFVNSASSDHEYTISEEEREQMREARVYCGNLRAKLRSSCANQEKQLTTRGEKKYPTRKGKEKIEEMKDDDIGKQVCGICLSEEQKRTMRGVLNCCRHYFCFSCIMEWSKVESRCPLCKQRFTTITKAAKSDTGFDLRTVVIPVPECDQVYEPSEEELRGYLDPYESVICTECQNGGDDALMLLCDICDSSAHTFCVGLGREVPEGNWYCEGCKPTVFGTLNSQHLTPNADRRLGNNASDLSSSSSPVVGGFDLNELYVPETPLTQQTIVHHEPNPGIVATTLRDRRRIHRQIHHRLLNNNRMNDFFRRSSGASVSSSGIRLFGSQLDHSQNDHIFPSMHDSSNFYPRTDQFSVQLQNSNLASADVALQDEHVSLQEFKIH